MKEFIIVREITAYALVNEADKRVAVMAATLEGDGVVFGADEERRETACPRYPSSARPSGPLGGASADSRSKMTQRSSICQPQSSLGQEASNWARRISSKLGEQARAFVEGRGLTHLSRMPDDDPKIAEVWI